MTLSSSAFTALEAQAMGGAWHGSCWKCCRRGLSLPRLQSGLRCSFMEDAADLGEGETVRERDRERRVRGCLPRLGLSTVASGPRPHHSRILPGCLTPVLVPGRAWQEPWATTPRRRRGRRLRVWSLSRQRHLRVWGSSVGERRGGVASRRRLRLGFRPWG